MNKLNVFLLYLKAFSALKPFEKYFFAHLHFDITQLYSSNNPTPKFLRSFANFSLETFKEFSFTSIGKKREKIYYQNNSVYKSHI
jgi:hypothetical protein